ncbi:MAG: NAD(P)/FAD-dependent oxidoreductase [Bacteroidota bacterium]
MAEQPIVIIGAGVAGLVAALELEKAGYQPVLLEATERVGGRVKTDLRDGFRLDHGFQVLLTAYQEAQRYLDYEALDLRRFRPGAEIYKAGKSYALSDPLREPTRIFQAAFSPVGSLKDKFLVFKLTQELGRAEVASLFPNEQQRSSADFLKDYGFSTAFIDDFFRPFFGGIFLENELSTPAPMLQFVFKMFAAGHAALPAAGMEAIPQQLLSRLQQTTVYYQAEVARIADQKVYLTNGEQLDYGALVIATDPSSLLPQLAGNATPYHATTTWYFSSTNSPLSPKLIGLVPNPQRQVNNVCTVESVAPDYAPAGQQLVSVTLRDIPTQAQAEDAIIQELRELTNRPDWDLQPVARYDIPQALPALDQLDYSYTATEARVTDNIFLAGDQLLFGSLDAAMRSGRLAAEGLIETISDLVIT